jgi:formamidopyrimidine-DNA glycosylase
MPELPEVEVTRRRIAPLLVGRRIAKVHTTRPSYFFLTPPARLARELEGARVAGLERVGKYLLAGLDDGRRLLLHLGMTGQLFAEHASSVRLLRRARLARAGAAARVRARRAHAPGARVRGRRAARVLPRRAEVREGSCSARRGDKRREVGPTPCRDGRASRPRGRVGGEDRPRQRCRRRREHGADEALFLAKIRPKRAAGRLTRRECDDLAAAITQVLLRSIETGGSSISDYVAPDGADGAYQDERRVYARTREPCPECGTPIKRIVIAARSTHYCARCQR